MEIGNIVRVVEFEPIEEPVVPVGDETPVPLPTPQEELVSVDSN